MFTIILFVVASLLALKELGRAKGKLDLSRQSKIDRETEANDLASQNIALQRELVALKQAELHGFTQHQARHAQPAKAAHQPQEEQGFRYVNTKRSVQRKENQVQH